jgi:chemosensory pili system protein ChpA (sensor histidine kinase/response regulator)
MVSSEILDVLVDEVGAAAEEMGNSISRLGGGDEAGYEEARDDYLVQVERIASAAEVLELNGLEQVCAFVADNLGAIEPGGLTDGHPALLTRWPQILLSYLKAPTDSTHAREMAELFLGPEWPKPMDEAAASVLEQALNAIDQPDDSDAEQDVGRQTLARPEDVTLEFAADINPQLADIFLTEGPAQAGEYSALIQRVVLGEGHADDLNEARRLIHALKGEANTVEVRGVATLCHHVEDILEYLVDNAALPEGELCRLLVAVADTLEMMFESIAGTGEVPQNAQTVLQAVLDWANRLDRDELPPNSAEGIGSDHDEPSVEAEIPNAGQAVDVSALGVPALAESAEDIPTAPATEAEQRPSATPQQPPATQSPKTDPKVRVSARVIDEELRVSGEMSISRAHILERLQQAFKVIGEIRERHAALQQRSSDMEDLVTTQGVASGHRQAVEDTGSATLAGFDALELDEYGELHTRVHGLTEATADLHLLDAQLAEVLAAVNATVNQQALLHNELHEQILTSRMVPAGTLASRLQRTVRQVAERCGKSAALNIEGTDVMLDDQMINVIVDPLQHLLRNAIDHGLETTAQRAELHKGPIGKITLGFARDGNYLVVSCADDGAGLDLAGIRALAIQRGLIAADQNLPEDETARLILRPGFTTAATVTEVSGRGVGMDIVNTSIAKLKGSIGIRTQAGQGTTFRLRVPISMGIVHCLLVKSDGHAFAIPTDDLDRIVFGGALQVEPLGDGWLYRDSETGCPAYSLGQLAGHRSDSGFGHEDDERHVVLVNDMDNKAAVVVDAVTNGRDLVIKAPGRHVSEVKGLLGASILGDGSVVPILELTEMLRLQRGEAAPAQSLAARAEPDAPEEGDILVVDDSLSLRTALSALLTEEGFKVRTAKDGVEAIEAIQKQAPAAVLADFEMPRMNGIELTTHIRADEATRNLPVIIVTSRTTQKHRSLAEAAGANRYVTKPYRESDLLLLLRTTLSNAA